MLGNKVEVKIETLKKGGTNDLFLLKYLNQEGTLMTQALMAKYFNRLNCDFFSSVNEFSKKISDAISSAKRSDPKNSATSDGGGSKDQPHCGGGGGRHDSQKPGDGKMQTDTSVKPKATLAPVPYL